MTHSEFRRDHQAVQPGLIEPTDCPGDLGVDYPQCCTDPVDGHEVRIYRCAACGATIVWDATADTVRNDYPDPRRMVAALGARMKGGGA